MATCRKITVTLPESLIQSLDRADVRALIGRPLELDRSQLIALAVAELLSRRGFAGPVSMEPCEIAGGDEVSHPNSSVSPAAASCLGGDQGDGSGGDLANSPVGSPPPSL